MRPPLGVGDGNAAVRRGSWEGSRLRISVPVALSGAAAGPLFNSAGEYRATTGEPGGRGFRRNGDWTTAAGAGAGAGCTA